MPHAGDPFRAIGLAAHGRANDDELTPDASIPIPALEFDRTGALVIRPSATSSQHDFDYLVGNWKLKNRKLASRLTQSTEWIRFVSRVEMHQWSYCDGAMKDGRSGTVPAAVIDWRPARVSLTLSPARDALARPRSSHRRLRVVQPQSHPSLGNPTAMRETRILGILMLLALPMLGWTVRHSLNIETLKSWLIVGAFVCTGSALVLGVIVAWGRLAAWLKRPRSPDSN